MNLQDYFNFTDPELQCLLKSLIDPYPGDGSQLYCNSTWDQVSCWPTTLAGNVATIPCFGELRNIKYNTAKNASRLCQNNGSWAVKSDYSDCKPLNPDYPEGQNLDSHTIAVTIIYYVGYSLSLLALFIALWIFVYFKSLRCLRNTIHCHLLLTYILCDLCWIIMTTILVENHSGNVWICRMLISLFNYFHVTNFFWMFLEGLHLYTLVVRALKSGKFNIWIYAAIGWGIPLIIIIAWILVKQTYQYQIEGCWMYDKHTYYDYVYIAPILLVLLLNFIFLAYIMFELVTKLRVSTTMESKQYRKAAKGLLILLPLLGITYVLVIAPPSDDKLVKVIFAHITALLVSTQGFSVSVFYCFLNSEVHAVIKSRVDRWQIMRTLAARRRSTRSSLRSSPTRESSLHSTINPRESTCSNAHMGNGYVYKAHKCTDTLLVLEDTL